jgi:hypothetical protein
MRFFKDAMARLLGALAAPFAADALLWPVPGPQPAAACGTGPP